MNIWYCFLGIVLFKYCDEMKCYLGFLIDCIDNFLGGFLKYMKKDCIDRICKYILGVSIFFLNMYWKRWKFVSLIYICFYFMNKKIIFYICDGSVE